jgi:hypothetical protein
MKHLSFSLILLVLLSFPTIAQHGKASDDDFQAVNDTVRNYIEAYYTGDPARMERTLHPHYLKHIIHGDIPVREKTGLQMVEAVRLQGVPEIPREQRTENITVLDVSEDIATAKLVTPGWVDYLTLSKFERVWKIISVVQRMDN